MNYTIYSTGVVKPLLARWDSLSGQIDNGGWWCDGGGGGNDACHHIVVRICGGKQKLECFFFGSSLAEKNGPAQRRQHLELRMDMNIFFLAMSSYQKGKEMVGSLKICRSAPGPCFSLLLPRYF